MRLRMRAVAILGLSLIAIGGFAAGAEGPPSTARSEVRQRQQALLDQLDDARINRDLLELEVAANKSQIQKMMSVLRETELAAIQGFSQGPVIGSGNPDEQRDTAIARYKQKLDHVCAEFVMKSKELSRERRRVLELEVVLGLGAAPRPAPAAAPAGPARAARSLEDAERVVDLILRGVETWQRTNPSAPEERSTPRSVPAPAPEERSLKDAERILELIRKGIETWQGDQPAAPEEQPRPRSEDRSFPEPRPAPKPAPDERLLKDAEQLLNLIRRGVDAWQNR